MITKKDWADWKTYEVTRELVKNLHERRQYIMEGVVEERYEGDYLKWVGHAQALKDIILFITEDWKDELEET